MFPIFVFREVDHARFEEVRSGIKTVETRAATEKYRAVQVGDEITFACGDDTFTKKVAKVYLWPTIEQVRERYASYPDYAEKLKEFGIIGFELSS